MTRTNAYGLLCMIIRAVAVWAAAKMVIGVPGAVTLFRTQPYPGFWWGWLALALLVEFVLIAAIWLFADKLAKLALVRPQDAQFESDLAPDAWFGLAVSAIGVWFCLGGILDACWQATRWLIVLRLGSEAYDNATIAEETANIVSIALQIVLGLALVLRGQGVSRWVHRLRYGSELPPAAERTT